LWKLVERVAPKVVNILSVIGMLDAGHEYPPGGEFATYEARMRELLEDPAGSDYWNASLPTPPSFPLTPTLGGSQPASSAAGDVGRSGALNKAKKDLGVARAQHPDGVSRVPLTERDGSRVLGPDGKPVMTREYSYTRPDGSKAIVQEHSAGHQFGEGGVGDQGPHFNVRPPENTRTGSVPGTDDHYPFNK